MARKRRVILAGMTGGGLWGLALLWLGYRSTALDGTDPLAVLPAAMAPAGLVLVALIGSIARRRFFDDAIIDGEPPAEGSPAAIDRAVLTNTVEQVAAALCLWPALGLSLGAEGGGVLMALGLGFGVSRALFWIGYHAAPPLRGFGFAAGFYPTVLAALWLLLRTAAGSG